MQQEIHSVGIVGRGAFGGLVATVLPKHIVVKTAGKSSSSQEFEAVAKCDVVVLAVPLGAYTEVLEQLAQHMPVDSLLVDVCSVKSLPAELINAHLPKHQNLLLCHPLFGPETYGNMADTPTMIITKAVGLRADVVARYCSDELGIAITHMTAEEHDKQMALVQGLTFFLARALSKLDITSIESHTPSFRHIQNLVNLDEVQSQELFDTMEVGNPYAKAARQQLMQHLAETEAMIEHTVDDFLSSP